MSADRTALIVGEYEACLLPESLPHGIVLERLEVVVATPGRRCHHARPAVHQVAEKHRLAPLGMMRAFLRHGVAELLRLGLQILAPERAARAARAERGHGFGRNLDDSPCAWVASCPRRAVTEPEPPKAP